MQQILSFLAFVGSVVATVKFTSLKPVNNGHPWDPKILAIVDRWQQLRGFSIKIAIAFDLVGLRLAVVGRWPLFRGVR